MSVYFYLKQQTTKTTSQKLCMRSCSFHTSIYVLRMHFEMKTHDIFMNILRIHLTISAFALYPDISPIYYNAFRKTRSPLIHVLTIGNILVLLYGELTKELTTKYESKSL